MYKSCIPLVVIFKKNKNTIEFSFSSWYQSPSSTEHYDPLMALSASSSSFSIPSNLSLLISNLSSFVTVKLDSTNYIVWKRQFQNIRCANGLIGYVEGTIECPTTKTVDASSKEVLNASHQEWIVIDAHLLSCITATLTPSIYTAILYFTKSHEVWSFLKRYFTSLSRSHVH